MRPTYKVGRKYSTLKELPDTILYPGLQQLPYY